MLYEWDVHHLHISSTIKSDGFVQRANPLLYAVFKPNDAYLIDILDHQSWTVDDVFEVMIDNWPDNNLVRVVPNSVGLERQVSATERAQLRNAGIATLFVERTAGCISSGAA